MGQCISNLQNNMDPPEEYRRRWSGAGDMGELKDGAYRPAATYATTANVGMGQDRYAYLPNKALRKGLDPIDEQKSMPGMLNGSPSRPGVEGGGEGSGGPPGGCGGPGGLQLPGSGGVGLGPAAGGRSPEQPLHWTRGDLIGQGAYGSVYLALDTDSGKLMAVKSVQLVRPGSKKSAEYVAALEAEVKMLQRLDHDNIVRYLATETSGDAMHIFMEYCPAGSIASLLAKFGPFQEPLIRGYTHQILRGLVYLHGCGIMHRDIKGANILVDNAGRVKLADFGASKQIEELATLGSGFKSVRGTPYWMAPEIIREEGHGREADIWSVACTVIEMATGRPPWSGVGNQVQAMFQIASSKGPPPIPEHLSADCKDFLYLCFNRKWKDRPPATQLLDHPFLAGIARTVAAPATAAAAAAAATTPSPALEVTQATAPAKPAETAALRASSSAVVLGGAQGERRAGDHPMPTMSATQPAGLSTELGALGDSIAAPSIKVDLS